MKTQLFAFCLLFAASLCQQMLNLTQGNTLGELFMNNTDAELIITLDNAGIYDMEIGSVVLENRTSITIVGNGSTFLGNGSFPLLVMFNQTSPLELVLTNLTFSNWSGVNGSVIDFQLTLTNITISDCIFSDNQGQQGGTIYTEDGFLTMTSVTFVNSSSSLDGGALWLDNCTANWQDVTFENCTSLQNGGALRSGASIQTSTWNDVTFSNCSSNANGGAAFLLGSIINTNRCSYISNRAIIGEAGALDLLIGSIFDTDSVFQNNEGANGGAIIVQDSAFYRATNVSFDGNRALNVGGAVDVEVTAAAQLIGCTFTNNIASSGGAISVIVQSQLLIRDCQILNNVGGSNGGAVFVETAEVDVENSTLSGNYAPRGTAFFCRGRSIVTFSESTVQGDFFCEVIDELPSCSVMGDSLFSCPDPNSNNDPILSNGAIAGIVIAAVCGCCFFLILTVAVFTASSDERRTKAKEMWQHLLGDDN